VCVTALVGVIVGKEVLVLEGKRSGVRVDVGLKVRVGMVAVRVGRVGVTWGTERPV
jgi:hypothetical protein